MSNPLRVALLSPDPDPSIRALVDGLGSLGHDARLVSPTPAGPIAALELRLRRRGYVEHLTYAPLAYVALRRGRDDVAHVAHPAGVPAAVRWSGETGRPFVFSYPAIPDHADLMSRRRKLELIESGVRHAAAVTAGSAAGAAAFERWLGTKARVMENGTHAESWAELYAEVAG